MRASDVNQLTLDPVIQALFQQMPDLPNYPMWEKSPEVAREECKEFSKLADPKNIPIGKTEAAEAQGPGGPIPLRIYTPVAAGAGVRPGILFFHGGGFVVGAGQAAENGASDNEECGADPGEAHGVSRVRGEPRGGVATRGTFTLVAEVARRKCGAHLQLHIQHGIGMAEPKILQVRPDLGRGTRNGGFPAVTRRGCRREFRRRDRLPHAGAV